MNTLYVYLFHTTQVRQSRRTWSMVSHYFWYFSIFLNLKQKFSIKNLWNIANWNSGIEPP